MNLQARTLLVVGGARSGKSRFAESLAGAGGREVVLVATAEAGDAEMAARIAHHRASWPSDWRVIEEPLRLAEAVARETAPARIVVVDCLTLWLSNALLGDLDPDAATAALAAAVSQAAGPLILVSNEVGAGIVPDNALARRFRDAQGRLNQAMAAVCDGVVEVRHGLPQRLKPAAPINSWELR